MKHFLLTLAVLLSLSISSFADDVKVSSVVLESFNSSFKKAKEVNWSVKSNLYKASFVLDGQYITAFYDFEDRLLAMTRNLSSSQLPISLQASLKEEEGFWISELFEVSNDEGTSYYVKLENADTMLVLKATANSSWTTYQKERKS
jgi:hypothetical protein